MKKKQTIKEEKKTNQEKLRLPSKKSVSIVIGALLALSSILTIWLGLESFRIVLGSFYVLFLPGFVITYNFFKEQEWLERIALSFALSIAIVPLITFYLSLIGMKITAINTSLIILGIIIISIIISLFQNGYFKK